ncbi:LacI family DNA-binding transcriptional regulator [Kribbella albertanoniae]|uniref:LacI family transcriptional regulator n=1 Tax=Kribbella albertanoniae TaxID=1266829 RepID=A0A4R4PZT2_9ACTN|nr:LacI family DNA-binding transcriptional regulator [Kribbella albertanoniae]TDC28120.1 LacI family transcriptional regulator [Kribbella albertanoniae]
MGRRVTLIDVARHAGVSRTTASYVITGTGRVSTATRERVQASIETLGYVYNEGAAALRRTGRTIGVIVPNIDRPFFGEVLSGVEATFTDSGYMALMVSTRDRLDQQARLVRMLREHQVAALAIVPATGSNHDLVDAIRSWDVPTVFLSRYVAGSTEPYVGSDEVRGGYLAADHLVRAHQCRSITYLGGPKHGVARIDRLEGVLRALAESGSDVKLVDLTSESTVEAGIRAGRELAAGGLPDGIICHNDSIAIGVARALFDAGHAGSTRIIGYDDIGPARASVPALTSVATSGRILGETAARALLAVISGAEPAVRSHLAEPRLIVRESCGDHI